MHEDGSAAFEVPARTPVYFQAIDAKGHVVQTMRSWPTLQPGETFNCVGCHEDKNEAPPIGKMSMAMKAGIKKLEPFYDISGQRFGFPKIIQPIFNAKCVSCHKDANGIDLQATKVWSQKEKKNWNQAYLSLVLNHTKSKTANDINSKHINWLSSQSQPSVIPAYTAGSSKSGLLTMLEKGHRGVTMTREEMDKLAAWIDLVVNHRPDLLDIRLKLSFRNTGHLLANAAEMLGLTTPGDTPA